MEQILQSEAAECGLASLAMIASHHGFKSDLVSLRQAFPQTLKGINLQQLMNIAEQLKLASRALKLDIDQVQNLTLPCILHWDMNHFVVLEKVSTKHVVIIDPAFGEKKLDYQEFAQHFTGVALELTPTESFEKTSSKKPSTFLNLIQAVKGAPSTLLQLALLSLVLQIFTLASPYYLQLVIDDVLINQDQQLLTVLALAFLLVTIFNALVSLLRQFVVIHLGASLNKQLAFRLFHHLIHLPLDYFNKRHIGDIVSRFSSIQYLKHLITTQFVEALIDGLMAITTLVLIFIYSIKLALIVVLVLALYLFVRLLWYRPLKQYTEQNIIEDAKEQSFFMESVRGIQPIKLSALEANRQSVWQNHYTQALNQEIKIDKLQTYYQLANHLLFGLENVVVIYFGALLILENDLFSIGMLTAFIAYKTQLTSRFASLVETLIEFKLAKVHFQRLADITTTSIENTNIQGIKHDIKGEITISSLNYRYSDSEPFILQDLTMKANIGRSVAIVGCSGAGKSTLMKLMLGLYTPNSGQIFIDDIPLSQHNLVTYRQQVACVMQDDELLTGTIAENISQFDPQMDLSRVVQAAKQAAIHHDIINMPMDYNSLIGDMGTTLSGGQKQRVLLARALYQEPKILFLDEATSHLDITTESQINHTLKHLKITRIMIAHRPETIASADHVYELQQSGLHKLR
jgi:ATP-binding cassette subfamily B protein RaxB